MNESYVIWSNEHKAWWGPGRAGYVARIADAGLYTRRNALDICFTAMAGRRGKEPLREIPVCVDDLFVMLERWKETYGDKDPEPEARGYPIF